MFNYEDAFSRNIGWLTAKEQQILRNKKVAIAGAGGVGFEHAVTLARLGISRFAIADFDEFEVHNMNRQAGAFMSTVEQPKNSVLARTLRDINPECEISEFPLGIHADNLDDFLRNADLFIDGLDFFTIDIRERVFTRCHEKGIPALTAAPLGMGVSLLTFMPGKMSFNDYFDMSEVSSLEEKCIKFLVGLSPFMLQRPYLVDPTAANFREHRGPSTPMAVKLCAGVTATNALKILLKRGKVPAAPHGLHFDAYRNKFKRSYLPFGNRGPLQKLKYRIAKSIVLKD
ncbi:ThiF family adenylyltransferase [Alteromonas aestuariivivens]|uniref:ThiF family adenylyltransferase n=1 Tax=Alteromonas aestuariivivens TaxID=1938339 RepID=A0A3D8MG56_9ALTE|nr:ThiF family adenylyltransferase [Alteromonas aestuariivivens]RDV29208.1 ThiF family adenylyltransferase [Alteromonas aestuariivivens]